MEYRVHQGNGQMSAEHKAKIRDRRKAGWFRIDDEIIEVYGPQIGAHGVAVYAALCKHAGKDESSHPGLRLLCEKLKIGRKKLLDTLAKLKEVGLIEIEVGDRAHVSVYTLLDVPKGGSNENQGVVLTRTRGGSEQHRKGGSNENRNQISTEPDKKYFDSSLRSESAGAENGAPPEKKEKVQDIKQYAVAQLVERVAAKARDAPIHSPTNSERKQFAQMFAQASKDGHDIDTLLVALDYQVAKAAGEIEGEPKAWCGYRTALDRVLEGWRPRESVHAAKDDEAHWRMVEENEKMLEELLKDVHGGG